MNARKMLTLVLLAGLALAGLCGPALAGTWSDLWSTHEQQGQKLLDGNHPNEAARLFSDPKRRAYAEAQAGQYGKAADLLAPMKDADSQYNRGNALARNGKLQDALAAYDAALAASPGNEDVLRNRDLVAKALENQPQQGGKNSKGQQGPSNGGQGSNGAGDKSGGKDSGSQDDGKSGKDPSQAGRQDPSGQQGQSAQQGQAGQQGQSAQQNQSGQQGQSAQQAQSGQQGQNGNPAQANAQNQPRDAAQSQSGQQDHPAVAGQQAQAANPSQNGSSAASASANATNSAQAQNPQQSAGAFAANPPGQHDQRNAAALQQGQASGTGTQRGPESMAGYPLVKGGAATDAPQSQPRSEQALALDQWMRSIPDDSGELLRRKFQIEHLMKQQGNEP